MDRTVGYVLSLVLPSKTAGPGGSDVSSLLAGVQGAEPPGLALQAHRHAHAAADAQGGQAFFRVAFLHFVQQGHEHAGA